VSRAAAAALLAAALLGGGCGTPSADLFVVERAGDLPDAKLDLVVGDGTSVTCDGRERPLANALLLDARELARELAPLLDRGVRLAPPPGAQLRFRVIGEQGEVRFADSSAARRPVFARVVAFTRAVAQQSCGLAR
jgi:hypothetical protein